MTGRQRFAAIVIGLAGVTASIVALVGFLLKIMGNRLESPDGALLPEFYRSVGAAYSDGFVAGFGLCFFLVLLAVAAAAWVDARAERTSTN